MAQKCEPLRSWNRMEVRPRKKDFDNTLRAEVYDPLWMLGRQWQFGEFQGEDTGSATLAKVALETTTISKFQSGTDMAEVYSDDIPLETKVEAENIRFDYKTRVKIGQQWFKILKSYGLLANFKSSLISNYPIVHPQIKDSDNATSIVTKAKLLSNHPAMQFVDAANERAMDGYLFYIHLNKEYNSTIDGIFGNSEPAIKLSANEAAGKFMQWFEKLYFYPKNGNNKAWNQKQMEYEFSCALPDEGGNTVLVANEYYSGSLDWFSFDIDKNNSSNGLGVNNSVQDAPYRTKRTFTVIPSNAQFGGMPNKRWWEFEDAAIDLGNISADEKNLAKILITEFALVYSNDWFVIPYDVPVGSLSKIKGIVVTDSFGQKTMVQAAGLGEQNDWNKWNMFSMTTLENPLITDVEVDNRIFFPPVLTKVHESDPTEMVKFVRDEMANMVWGVEDRIPNMLGESMSGDQAALDLVEFLKNLDTTEEEAEELAGVLKYELANTVPENWIPFIPLHLATNNRAIQLRRASMPRTLKHLYPNSPGQVRPRTDILRYGLLNNDTQQTPYDLFEEEVPKAGVQVMANYQRARWYDGKIFNWYGRRKQTGRGQGSSGLRFDTISEIKPTT